ncbi:uncharacterized protein Triagg1_10991 [Trichoderma aggressivum f. europaeum]|uniref:Uncharacterized protein n=1 Tax=Trichoderma aggressivum f. europaeum TaxID=173218 RepID=A0AAE1I848_9HYPO|nr:hypothetical protein Triagg1_10991 [Trichoderma aggressivum f. europaeum]
MYKRKLENNLAVVRKRAKIDCPDITPTHFEYALRAAPTTPLTPIVPEPSKKRKRSGESEAEASGDREVRRIKSSDSGSSRLQYPRVLSPASKYQIFSKTEDSSEEESQILGLASASDIIIPIDVVLPIRLARPTMHSPARTNLAKKKKKQPLRQQPPKQPKQQPLKQQTRESDKSQQPRKQQNKWSSFYQFHLHNRPSLDDDDHPDMIIR